MMLLTKANKEALPELYAQENEGEDAIAYVKFFTPDSSWTWYAMEFDGQDTFFGYVDPGNYYAELGYFLLSELKSARGPMGLPIERDRHFDPLSLRDIKAQVVHRVHGGK